MKSEQLVFYYMGICAAMILFNCVVLSQNFFRSKRLNIRDGRMKPKIRAHLEGLERGEGFDGEHLKQMDRVFKRTARLKCFEDSMDALIQEKPELCEKYIRELSPCFVNAASDYFKRDIVEATYFAGLIRKYKVAEKGNRDFWMTEMKKLLQTSSVYCRDNALHIVYGMENAEEIVNALLLLDEHQVFHHSKLIHDGLLKFRGDKKELLEEIWRMFERFSADMQVTLITYMRLSSGECNEQIFEVMMRFEPEDEVYFACMRYFGKFYYEPVYLILLDALSERVGQRWEKAAIAATALQNYQSERTIDVLTRALHSSNWYIRNNAAATLESFGLTYADMAEVFEGNDRYAREILQYWMDYRSVRERGRAL